MDSLSSKSFPEMAMEALDNNSKNQGIESHRNYVYEGIMVPSVTQIISSCTDKEALIAWSNRLGLMGTDYHTFMSKITNYGTAAHACIEGISARTPIKSEYSQLCNDATKEAYAKWLRANSAADGVCDYELIAHEQKLQCKWFGGTFDALYRFYPDHYYEKIVLVDYKTSNRIRPEYLIQLAAYVDLIRRSDDPRFKDLVIDEVTILQLSKTKPSYNTLTLNLHNSDDMEFFDTCTNIFYAMVVVYWNYSNISKQFNRLMRKTGTNSYFSKK